MAPVLSLGFSLPGRRGATVPLTPMTYSLRSSWARRLELGAGLGLEDDLGDAVAVAEVDEDQAAEVAPGVHPAVQDDGLSHVVDRQFTAGMRSFVEHDSAIGRQDGFGLCASVDHDTPSGRKPSSASRIPTRSRRPRVRGRGHAGRCMIGTTPWRSRTAVSRIDGRGPHEIRASRAESPSGNSAIRGMPADGEAKVADFLAGRFESMGLGSSAGKRPDRGSRNACCRGSAGWVRGALLTAELRPDPGGQRRAAIVALALAILGFYWLDAVLGGRIRWDADGRRWNQRPW